MPITFTLTGIGSYSGMPNPRYGSLANGSNVLAIASGQSNWRSNPLGSPYTGSQPTAQVWSGTTFVNYDDQHDAYDGPFRNSLAFALEFNDRYPNLNLYLIEVGEGGQGFRAGAGSFAINGSVSTTLNTYLVDAVTYFRNNQISYYLGGLFFWQGEEDSNQTSWANAYLAQAGDFFDRLDASVEQSLHRHIVRIHPDTPGPGTSIVRAAHETLANTLINIDGFPTLGDNLHFSPADYETIGRSFVTISANTDLILVDNSNEPPPVDPPALFSFRDFLQMSEPSLGTLLESPTGNNPKGATSSVTFAENDYVQFTCPVIANSTSWLVELTATDDQDYLNDGNQTGFCALIPQTSIFRRMPAWGGGGTDVSITHIGDGVVFRMHWVGNDVRMQWSDDNGATFTTGHTYTGVMAGAVDDSVVVKAYTGFSSGSKTLTNFTKGTISP